jgi:hypothetical protein
MGGGSLPLLRTALDLRSPAATEPEPTDGAS